MILLGIDPGIERMGYAVVDNSSTIIPLEYGLIRTDPSNGQPERLFEIWENLKSIIEKYKPYAILTETVFFAKNLKTANIISEVRGVIKVLSVEYGLKFYEFSPLQVKMAISGYGKATKNQVKKAVQLILNLKEMPDIDDVIDALAICICGSGKIKWRN
jgi:crossover junction endodeoxyribonuclease RuvC